MRRKQIIALLVGYLALSIGCKGPEKLSTHNLFGGEILTVVHGCGGFETYRNNMPPNTLETLERSLAEGADAIEMDVQMTADSHLVLFHDSQLDSKTTCHGCIHAKTLAEIQQCRYKTRNGPTDGDYPIPLLDSALARIAAAQRKVLAFVNTKHGTPCEPAGDAFPDLFARQVAAHVAKSGLKDQALVESLDASFLDRVYHADSSLQLLFDDENFERGLAAVRTHNFVGLVISNGIVTEAQVKEAHKDGYWLGIWGVKVISGCRTAIAKGPEFIMTDDLLMLQAALHE
jgi:glycerophosphoryl diester phosphodiesterase